MTDSRQNTTSLQMTSANFDIVLIPAEVSHNILPAVRFQISCTIHHPTGIFLYQADDIWIDFETLDQFIGELGRIVNHLKGTATLICLAQTFKFELFRQDKGVEVAISITQHSPQHLNTRLNASFLLEEPDLINTWYRNFSEFRR